MTPWLAETGLEPTTSWHYAAWVSIDLRMLAFSCILAALLAAVVTSLVLRSERRLDYLALWLLVFLGMLALTLTAMNLLSAHPVFVVESFFPFP